MGDVVGVGFGVKGNIVVSVGLSPHSRTEREVCMQARRSRIGGGARKACVHVNHTQQSKEQPKKEQAKRGVSQYK